MADEKKKGKFFKSPDQGASEDSTNGMDETEKGNYDVMKKKGIDDAFAKEHATNPPGRLMKKPNGKDMRNKMYGSKE